ncbi:MAG TPA: hypothetical protein VKX17_17690 [Planctomycetota bacterium]|nr:hypothetical protein [Planctomycetota bacterium]
MIISFIGIGGFFLTTVGDTPRRDAEAETGAGGAAGRICDDAGRGAMRPEPLAGGATDARAEPLEGGAAVVRPEPVDGGAAVVRPEPLDGFAATLRLLPRLGLGVASPSTCPTLVRLESPMNTKSPMNRVALSRS